MTHNENEQKTIKRLTEKIQRILFINKISTHLQDDLKNDIECPYSLKVDVGSVKRAMIAQKNNILKTRSWSEIALVNQDLEQDKLHTISCILDKLFLIENVEDVLEWLNEMTVNAKLTQNG